MLETWQANQERVMFYNVSVFRRLLDAFSRPGTILQLPFPDALDGMPTAESLLENIALNPFLIGALASLLDREASFVVAADGHWLGEDTALERWLQRSTGAKRAPATGATFALCLDGTSGALVAELSQGTDTVPEDGATAFIGVAHLSHETRAGGTTLELRGPGIKEAEVCFIAGLPGQALVAIHQARSAYPLGVDVYLVDVAGRCVGLPRTTRMTQVGG